jgi:hypothetical protein
MVNSNVNIIIFNCANNKFFVTFTHSRDNSILYGQSDPISNFIDIFLPKLNVCDFIKTNNIIGIKDRYIYKDKNNRIHYDQCEIPDIIDNIVLKYMQEYGINSVRGGTYTDININKYLYQIIRNELIKIYGSENPINDNSQLEEISTNQDTIQDTIQDTFQINTDISNIDILSSDLNKMSYFIKILNLTEDIEQINFSLVIYFDQVNDQDQKTKLKIKNPILNKIKSYHSLVHSGHITDQYIHMSHADGYFPNHADLTTKYLNIKIKLKSFRYELVKLEAKYGSIENLQNIINKLVG